MSRSSKGSLPYSSTKILHVLLFIPIHVTCLTHLIVLDFIAWHILRWMQVVKFCVTQFFKVLVTLLLSLFSPNNIFLNPLSLCTHYKTTLYLQMLLVWGYEVRYAVVCTPVRFFQNSQYLAWLPSYLNESCSSVVLLQTSNRCQKQPSNSAALVASVK